MRVHLARGLAGPLVTDMVIRLFSLGGHMYQVDDVLMDLHGTYDGILGLNFFMQHGLLMESNSFVQLLEAGSVNLSALGLQKLGAPVSHAAANLALATTTVSFTDTHPTLLQTCMATESDSLTDVLCKLQTEFHDVFCNDLGDM